MLVRFVNWFVLSFQACVKIVFLDGLSQHPASLGRRFMKYGNVLHNYGAIPQTWEDPGHTVSEVNNLPGMQD
jgi:hypothetical protein